MHGGADHALPATGRGAAVPLSVVTGCSRTGRTVLSGIDAFPAAGKLAATGDMATDRSADLFSLRPPPQCAGSPFNRPKVSLSISRVVNAVDDGADDRQVLIFVAKIRSASKPSCRRPAQTENTAFGGQEIFRLHPRIIVEK